MNKKSVWLVSAAALLGAMLLSASVRAEDAPQEKPKHEKKVGPRTLKKFDKNHDGVLDEEEKAAWEADKARKREERKAKKAKADGEKKPADEEDDDKPQK